MRIAKLEIAGYRSILDAEIEIDTFTTVLMGRNDVGKSNIIQALLAFSSRRPFSRDDRCRHASVEAQPRVALHYCDITDTDRDRLTSLPIPLSAKNSLVVAREGNDLAGYAVSADGKGAPPERLSEAPPPPPEPTQESGDSTGDQGATTTRGEEPARKSALWKQTVSQLWTILPAIASFQSPAPLPSRITIDELNGSDPKFETARRLLRLAGAQEFGNLAGEDLAFARDYRREVSRTLSSLIQANWFQDKDLAVEVDYQAPHLLFVFREATPRSTYPEQHSEATNEFVAILADFLLQLSAEPAGPGMLLLDEPGTRLHPGGQKDLLALVRSLSRRCQILYTSHSPHLIDRNYPGQIRLVRKTDHGTVVDNKPHTSQEPFFVLPYEPIRSAIGVGIGDALFFDQKNVILEGPSDQIIIGALSQAVAGAGLELFLDLNITALIPAGSVNNTEMLSRMAKGRSLQVVALFDSDQAGQAEAQRLAKKHQDNPRDGTTLPPNQMLSMDDPFPDKKPRCSEDFVPVKTYFDAVNSLYARIFPDWKLVTPKTAPFRQMSTPIAGAFSKYFEDDLKGEFGGFDKVRVARELASSIRELDVKKADGSVRLEFEPVIRLFGMINDALEGKEPQRVPPASEEKAVVRQAAKSEP